VRDSNPDENLDAEGIPQTDGQPGKNIETSEEAMMAPRDYSVAAGSDPAYPVTAEEERAGETVAARAAREEPDFGEPGSRSAAVADRAAVGARLMDPDSDIDEIDLTDESIALVGEGDRAPTAEEAAVHVVSEDDLAR
jgi:hypothetical protein